MRELLRLRLWTHSGQTNIAGWTIPPFYSGNSIFIQGQFYSNSYVSWSRSVPSPKLTAFTWKLMAGRWNFLLVRCYASWSRSVYKNSWWNSATRFGWLSLVASQRIVSKFAKKSAANPPTYRGVEIWDLPAYWWLQAYMAESYKSYPLSSFLITQLL